MILWGSQVTDSEMIVWHKVNEAIGNIILVSPRLEMQDHPDLQACSLHVDFRSCKYWGMQAPTTRLNTLVPYCITNNKYKCLASPVQFRLWMSCDQNSFPYKSGLVSSVRRALASKLRGLGFKTRPSTVGVPVTIIMWGARPGWKLALS